MGEDRASENHISTPKTEAGMRTIPMLDTVKDAFEMIWEEQKENGWTDAEIDGMTGFVFCNRYGNIMNAQSVNRAIKRISSAYNATEGIEAKKEHREPVLLPDFSAHSLRHTFCTRLCEREMNLKIIQSIMGHKDIQTTMDIYAEATEEKKQETIEIAQRSITKGNEEKLKKFPTMKSIGGVKAENGVSSKSSEEVKAEPEKIDFSNVKIEPLFEEEVDFDTFSKSDFRAVKVKECVAVPKSKKLLQFTLDDGTGTDRTILSGIHAYYEPEELVGKTLIAITNLPPRKMMGIESCGMLLSAVNNLKDSEDEELHLLMVDNHIPAGAKLY